MARMFHIGVGEDGNFAVNDVSQIPDSRKAGLSGQFGQGYDESARRAAIYEMAMMNFPSPQNK